MEKGAEPRAAEAAVIALHDAYNRHDAAEAAGLYAEGGTHEDVAAATVAQGPDAIREGLEQLFAAVPDVRWSAERVGGDGSHATASYRMTGTLRGRLGPFEPRGQALELFGVHVVEIDADGRIARSTDHWDGRELARQMRAQAPVPSAAGPQEVGAIDIPAVDPDGFRRAMRLLAGGVAVVTTMVGGRPWGITVSACCSLTAEPPQVLVSLRSETASCRAIVDGGHFGVDLLGADQVEVARVCSATGRPKFIEDFVDEGFGELPSPVIADSLAHLDCRVVDTHGVGDHLVVIGLVGAVLSLRSEEELEPLVYFGRAFRTLGAALG